MRKRLNTINSEKGKKLVNIYLKAMRETNMKNTEDLISIIIPVYNSENYIDKCLQSVTTQSYKNIEIICVNDGSSDESLNLLHLWEARDSRIVIISQSNSGVSCARNSGMKIAKGKFIFFLDCDDCISVDAIEVLHTYIKNGDIAIGRYSCDINKLGEGKGQIIDIDPFKMALILLNFKKYNRKFLDKVFGLKTQWDAGYSWGRLLKKQVLDDNKIIFPEHLFLGEDVLFNLKLFLCSKQCILVNRVIYFYRQSENSVTAKFQPKRLENTKKLCKSVIESTQENEPELFCAAKQFVFGRVIHCYISYFSHVDRKNSDIIEQIQFLSDPNINSAVIDSKIKYCTFGKKRIPLIFLIKVKSMIINFRIKRQSFMEKKNDYQ